MIFLQNIIFRVFILNLIIIFAGVVYAEGMEVKPGMWEMKSVVTLPFDGGKQERSSQDCIDKSSITPQEMMNDAEGCEILDSDVNAKKMTWSIRCQNPQVEMTGDGHAKSTGTTVSGGMNISATYSGQEMKMSTTWEGKHVGACN